MNLARQKISYCSNMLGSLCLSYGRKFSDMTEHIWLAYRQIRPSKVNFVFRHVADMGWMDAQAGKLLRYRKNIGANHIKISLDIKVS